VHGVSTKKPKPDGFNEERILRDCTTTQEIPMRFDGNIQSARDELDHFSNENSVTDYPSEGADFIPTAISDQPWQEPGDLFDGLGPDLGLPYDGSGASVMPSVGFTICNAILNLLRMSCITNTIIHLYIFRSTMVIFIVPRKGMTCLFLK
jgi:hypothetical protein